MKQNINLLKKKLDLLFFENNMKEYVLFLDYENNTPLAVLIGLENTSKQHLYYTLL